MRATGWLERYRRSSQSVRVHQYFRYSLYSLSFVEALLVVAIAGTMASEGAEPWVLAALVVSGETRALLGLLLTRAGLRYYLGQEPRPRRLLAVFVAVTFVALVPVLAGVATDALPREGLSLAVYVAAYFAGPVLLVLPLRRGVALAALPVLAMAGGGLVLGVPAVALASMCLSMLIGASLLGFSWRASAWTLQVFDRLEQARETEARLAVAEERLRFGRDLHDVLGRNLSVIALKSELAAQLAQRGSAAAVDQMTEVQRIARDSQREIREVVRGYRAADLHTELAGARGVLLAAGIGCAIEERDGGGLPRPVQSALGWVVREGTTNVLRHADAATCTVRLRRTAAGEAVLEMENDGVRAGAGPDGEGTGLAGLRERLATLGGSLHASPGPGGTFRLTARIPLREATAPEEAMTTA